MDKKHDPHSSIGQGMQISSSNLILQAIGHDLSRDE